VCLVPEAQVMLTQINGEAEMEKGLIMKVVMMRSWRSVSVRAKRLKKAGRSKKIPSRRSNNRA
jgi:hypothetical protein